VKTSFLLFFLGVLVFLNVLVWQEIFDFVGNPYLEVIFFDVGQGDAIFIETPQKHQILIDGGPDSGILEKLGRVMPFWDKSIDLIILTHPEHDHFAGLIEVLKRYKVENILWTGVVRDTAEYQEWLELINKEKAKIYIAKSGRRITTNPALGVIEILYPLENLEGQVFKNANNSSVITQVTFRKNTFLNSTEGKIQGSEGVKFLFTGDAYKSIERKLINQGINLDSDILKVGHHGSKTSTAEEFIKQVSPEIAVISAGKNNPYGHPHQETLDTLEKYGIDILRTDKEGDIKIFSDGKNLTVKSKIKY